MALAKLFGHNLALLYLPSMEGEGGLRYFGFLHRLLLLLPFLINVITQEPLIPSDSKYDTACLRDKTYLITFCGEFF